MAWQIPSLNLLVGDDRNTLQDIFITLQRELKDIHSRIDELQKLSIKEKR